jgi:hypothetical protein
MVVRKLYLENKQKKKGRIVVQNSTRFHEKLKSRLELKSN